MCEAYYDSRAHELVKAIEKYVEASINRTWFPGESSTDFAEKLPQIEKELVTARDNLVREISKILKDRS